MIALLDHPPVPMFSIGEHFALVTAPTTFHVQTVQLAPRHYGDDTPAWERIRWQIEAIMYLQGWDTLPPEVCYLLCLHQPLIAREKDLEHPGIKSDAFHYLGTTGRADGSRPDSLFERLGHHLAGDGDAARFTQVCAEREIGWDVARLWIGGRGLEARLKHWDFKRFCPICAGEAAWNRGIRHIPRKKRRAA